MTANKAIGGMAILTALGLAGWAAPREGRTTLALAAVTAVFLYFWGRGLWGAVNRLRGEGGRWPGFILRALGLLAGLAVYAYASLWLIRPDLLPQRSYYDLIANRQVTERLVDPALMKVERWDISGREMEVLFVHPSSSGSTTLVYPLKIEPKTSFSTSLAMAPQAWAAEGDGVTFSVALEDEAGYHLLYSQYIDPKHQQQDQRWLPVRIDLSAFEGKLVRFILVTNSGLAGDLRYDWAGWGQPRLEQPAWP